VNSLLAISEFYGRSNLNSANGQQTFALAHQQWGLEKRFDTEITEQIPDKRIAWRSLSGAPNPGVVTFHSLNPETTRIMLQMECELDGVVETAGDMLGVASHRIQGRPGTFQGIY
jgi:uncharacterized membrane protein